MALLALLASPPIPELMAMGIGGILVPLIFLLFGR